MKMAFALAGLLIIFYSGSSFAAASAYSAGSAACRKGADVYIFQDASDAIAGFHIKLWPTQPMKALGPVKKSNFMWFQRIADSIEGNWTDAKDCPAAGKK
jgi:hypothetical protein